MRQTTALRFLAPALLAVAAPAMAQEGGTRIVITLNAEELPEPRHLVQALEAVGAQERAVKVKRIRLPSGEELTLELWGAFAPAEEIPGMIREAFPSLARAEIVVSGIDASERPRVPPPGEDGSGGERRVLIKKTRVN